MTLLTFALFLVLSIVLSFLGQSISLKDVQEKYKEYLKNAIVYSVTSLISLVLVYLLLY